MTPSIVLKQKLEQKLIRKGYSFEIISEALPKRELERDDEVMQALQYQAEKLERKSMLNETGYPIYPKNETALYRKGFST